MHHNPWPSQIHQILKLLLLPRIPPLQRPRQRQQPTARRHMAHGRGTAMAVLGPTTPRTRTSTWKCTITTLTRRMPSRRDRRVRPTNPLPASQPKNLRARPGPHEGLAPSTMVKSPRKTASKTLPHRLQQMAPRFRNPRQVHSLRRSEKRQRRHRLLRHSLTPRRLHRRLAREPRGGQQQQRAVRVLIPRRTC